MDAYLLRRPHAPYVHVRRRGRGHRRSGAAPAPPVRITARRRGSRGGCPASLALPWSEDHALTPDGGPILTSPLENGNAECRLVVLVHHQHAFCTPTSSRGSRDGAPVVCRRMHGWRAHQLCRGQRATQSRLGAGSQFGDCRRM